MNSTSNTAEQPSLPTLEWPALVPGPVLLCFEWEGKPPHKGRHRSMLMITRDAWSYTGRLKFIPEANVRDHKKVFIHHYSDKDTEAHEKAIAQYAGLMMRNRPPSEKPLAVLVHAFREIPASWSAAEKARALAGHIVPTSRPDGDNYLKLAQDALNGIVFKDDSQIVDARVIKRYSDRPALRVEIREMVEP